MHVVGTAERAVFVKLHGWRRLRLRTQGPNPTFQLALVAVLHLSYGPLAGLLAWNFLKLLLLYFLWHSGFQP